jgi:thiamine-phosphate pyrophosphorylase
MSEQAVIRILDASLNRAGEGLRVVEDFVRFALDDGHLTRLFKQLRHDLAAGAAAAPWSERHAARDTQEDVGTAISTRSEEQRADAWEVCQASLERVKQSLRSLEEFSKVSSPDGAARFESLRYRLYTLEAALGRTVDADERLAGVRLYVLVDGRESEAAFVELVRELIEGGAGAIQLRDKSLCDRKLIGRARLLVETVRCIAMETPNSPDLARSGLAAEGARRPLVIINNRPDVAAIVDADGVHLGQDDIGVKDARMVLGPRKLVGVSTHSIEQARAAVLSGATYIGVGPTFPSKTKEFASFPGLGLLRQVAAEIRLPAFAIGGIDRPNIADVLATGCNRIAVSSAVSGAQNPREAAMDLRAALENACK